MNDPVANVVLAVGLICGLLGALMLWRNWVTYHLRMEAIERISQRAQAMIAAGDYSWPSLYDRLEERSYDSIMFDPTCWKGRGRLSLARAIMLCPDPRHPDRVCPWSATCHPERQAVQQQLSALGERCQTYLALEGRRSWGRLGEHAESECPF